MATKYGGYQGRVIKIDLTTKEISDYPWSDTDRRLFIGGKVMAAKIIYDNITEKIDAFSPENMLVITTGPFTGNGVPSSARFNVSGISPQTGLCASSNCGGSFGWQLKRCGYDAVIITGKAEDKTMIQINETGIKFLDATELWGLKTGAVQQKIGGKSGKFVIGPAGENLVKYSGIVSDERIAGRAGLGAVMGSKNLKAITAEGARGSNAANKPALESLCKKWTLRLRTHPLTGNQLPRYGTAGLVTGMQAHHILATKNFGNGRFKDFEKVSGELLTEKYLIKNKGCLSCPIQCTRVVPVYGKAVKGPELEVLGLLGPNILNNDLEKILEWNYELDEWGMDTISFAGTVAFAMELSEKGMWNSGLEFGKIDNITSIIEQTALRSTDVGNQIAEGSKWLSNKYGGADFAINVKGLELSAYEPRSAVGMGLGYAVSNRGGCHLNGGYLVIMEGLGLSINQYTPAGKAAFTMVFQDLMEAVSAAGNCLFTTYALFPFFLISKPHGLVTTIVNKVAPYIGGIINVANHHPSILAVNITTLLPHTKALEYCTGIPMNVGKLKMVGERGYNLERLINIRMGVKSSDDTLPKKLTDTPQIKGKDNSRVPIDKLRKKYYYSRGWVDGVPSDKTLKRLSLTEETYKKEVEKDLKANKKNSTVKAASLL